MVGNSRVINGISSFFQPTKLNATKRSATKAGLNSDDGVYSGKLPKSSATTRKFQVSWKNEFPWVIHDAGLNTMFCEFCRKASSKIAGGTDERDHNETTTTIPSIMKNIVSIGGSPVY